MRPFSILCAKSSAKRTRGLRKQFIKPVSRRLNLLSIKKGAPYRKTICFQEPVYLRNLHLVTLLRIQPEIQVRQVQLDFLQLVKPEVEELQET